MKTKEIIPLSYDDTIAEAGILPFLRVDNCKLKLYDSVDSTNNVAKEMAVTGAEHGTVVLANVQTKGRGRYGRSFFSPSGHGIYMTFILQPDTHWPVEIPLITLFAGVIICEAIEALCNSFCDCSNGNGIQSEKKSPKVKWVNDVFLDGKKICGILTEAVTDQKSGTIQRVIVGIGINFTASDLPVEIKHIAGSVFGQEHPSFTRNQLVAEIINRLLSPTYSANEIIDKYRQRLFILGKKVKVEGQESQYEATVLNVDSMGRLLVKNMSGDLITLSAGEVSIKAYS